MIYMIDTNEDGEVSLRQYTEDEFLKKLNDGHFGDGDHPPKFKGFTAFDSDLQSEAGAIVIRGEIVVPKAVERVSKYEL